MKALIKERPAPGIAYRDVPDPKLHADQVLVRVECSGISGSHVDRFRWTAAYHAGGAKDMTKYLPRVMGHEFSGTIAAVGEHAHGWREGDRVAVQSVLGCGVCDWCSHGLVNLCAERRTLGIEVDGGFAELAAVPVQNVYRLPNNVSFEAGALMQPFAIAMHAVERASIKPGERIGVWGAGQIGLSIVQAAQIAGARVDVVVARSAARLDAARALGANATIAVGTGDAAAALNELMSGAKLDVVFEASGSARGAIAAFDGLGKRGRLVLIGNIAEPLHANLLPAIFREISMLGVHTYSLDAWQRALDRIDLVESQRTLLPLTKLPLAQGLQAFERAARGEGTKFLLHR